MRLSEAILLGDSLRERSPDIYLSESDGGCKGCALGGAWLAAGRTIQEWFFPRNGGDALSQLQKEWPWLTGQQRSEIGHQFYRVKGGMQTLEQLADYVRSIEPAEPSEAVCGEGPNGVTERAELLKV